MNEEYSYDKYLISKYINELMDYVYNIYNVNSTNIYDKISKILYNVISEIDISTNKYNTIIKKTKSKQKNINKPKEISPNRKIHKFSKLNFNDVNVLKSQNSNLFKILKHNERIGGGNITIRQHDKEHISSDNYILLYENMISNLKVFIKYDINTSYLELLFKYSDQDFLIKGDLNTCQINNIEVGGKAKVNEYSLENIDQIRFIDYRLILKIYTQVAIVLSNIVCMEKNMNIDRAELIKKWLNNYVNELSCFFQTIKNKYSGETSLEFFNTYETLYTKFINGNNSQPITNTNIDTKNKIGTCYLFPLMPALNYRHSNDIIISDDFNSYVSRSLYNCKDIISYLKCGIIWDIVAFYIFGMFDPTNDAQIQQIQIQQIQQHNTKIDDNISQRLLLLRSEEFMQTYGSIFTIDKITPVYGSGHAGFYINNGNKNINNSFNSTEYSNINDMIHIYDGNHIENGPIYNLCMSDYNKNVYNELAKIPLNERGLYPFDNSISVNIITLDLNNFRLNNPNFNETNTNNKYLDNTYLKDFGQNYKMQIYITPKCLYYNLNYDLFYNNSKIVEGGSIYSINIKEHHKQLFSVCTHVIIDLLYGIWTIMKYTFRNDDKYNEICQKVGRIKSKNTEAKKHKMYCAIEFFTSTTKENKAGVSFYQNVPQISELNNIVNMKQAGGCNIRKYILFFIIACIIIIIVIIIIMKIKKITFFKHHNQHSDPISQN